MRDEEIMSSYGSAECGSAYSVGQADVIKELGESQSQQIATCDHILHMIRPFAKQFRDHTGSLVHRVYPRVLRAPALHSQVEGMGRGRCLLFMLSFFLFLFLTDSFFRPWIG